MVVYPVVYVVCTIPLASARMASMNGNPPSYGRLCLCGIMITSNGWLDVLLYTMTRRIMIFSDVPPADDKAIDTFLTFWERPQARFGATTIIEAHNEQSASKRRAQKGRNGKELVMLQTDNESSDKLYDNQKDIKLVTTTQVVNEAAKQEDLDELGVDAKRNRARTPVRRWSEDSSSDKNMSLDRITY